MKQGPEQDNRERLLKKKSETLANLGVKFDTLARLGRMAEEDQAVISHEEFVSLRLNRLEWTNLQRVNAALVRLDSGEYGICQECGEPISQRRLEVIPWAEFCVTCQERQTEEQEEEPAFEMELVRR